MLFDPVIFTEVALVALTVSVEELPVAIEVGFAEMVTVGALEPVTTTVVVADAVPFAPRATAV